MYHTIGVAWLLHLFWLGFPFSPSAHTFPEVKPHEDEYHVVIARAAKRHQVEIELVKAMIMVESRYDPEAVSDSGALGLMQLMPATAEMLGVKDSFDPHQNVNAGVAYFKQLKDQFDGNVILALAAYNAGPTRVRKCGGIPQLNSTRRYILKVITCYLDYKKQTEWFPDLLRSHWELRGTDDIEEKMDTSAVQKVYERITEDGMTNVWDRYEAQGLGGDPDKRCPFCMGGVRCDFCSNGPCRADAEKDKRGVCGIKADGMAMRMMALRNVMGAATYQFHTDQTIKTLVATARDQTPFEIEEPEKLRSFAQSLGIDTSGSPSEIALALCDFVETDFNRKTDEPSHIVDRLAPAERKEI